MRWKCYIPSETRQVKMEMCLKIVESDAPVAGVSRCSQLITHVVFSLLLGTDDNVDGEKSSEGIKLTE